MVFFGGASNFQKDGENIPSQYPLISVLYGVKHCISLFLSDVANIPALKTLTKKRKHSHWVFGSGSFHEPFL